MKKNVSRFNPWMLSLDSNLQGAGECMAVHLCLDCTFFPPIIEVIVHVWTHYIEFCKSSSLFTFLSTLPASAFLSDCICKDSPGARWEFNPLSLEDKEGLAEKALQGSSHFFPSGSAFYRSFKSHREKTQRYPFYPCQVCMPTGMYFTHGEESSLLIAKNYLWKVPGSRIFIIF